MLYFVVIAEETLPLLSTEASKINKIGKFLVVALNPSVNLPSRTAKMQQTVTG